MHAFFGDLEVAIVSRSSKLACAAYASSAADPSVQYTEWSGALKSINVCRSNFGWSMHVTMFVSFVRWSDANDTFDVSASMLDESTDRAPCIAELDEATEGTNEPLREGNVPYVDSNAATGAQLERLDVVKPSALLCEVALREASSERI